MTRGASSRHYQPSTQQPGHGQEGVGSAFWLTLGVQWSTTGSMERSLHMGRTIESYSVTPEHLICLSVDGEIFVLRLEQDQRTQSEQTAIEVLESGASCEFRGAEAA